MTLVKTKMYSPQSFSTAPVNLKMVPPNLRSFVTPSIRQLYIDSHSPEEEEEENITPIASTSSEISRLQAENHALHSHCTMWRRRADMQGSANLNLVKLIQTIQNQASQLAQERNELDRRFSWLKRKLDDHELGRILFFGAYAILIAPYQIVDTRKRH